MNMNISDIIISLKDIDKRLWYESSHELFKKLQDRAIILSYCPEHLNLLLRQLHENKVMSVKFRVLLKEHMISYPWLTEEILMNWIIANTV